MNSSAPKKPAIHDRRSYDDKCVCQICTCGRHHCPTSSHKPFQAQTTHHHDYKAYSIDARREKTQCNHQYQERHYDPNALKTNYDLAYVPHRIEPCPIDGTAYKYRPSTAKFYDETEYKKNYQNKEIAIDSPIRCSHVYSRSRAKFDGTTTYNASFVPKKAQFPHQPTHSNYQRRKVPFQGTTTYDNFFKPHELQPVKKGPCICYNKNTTKFEGQSHYKMNYQPYQIEHEAHCPINDLPTYPTKCSPGKSHVNYNHQKNYWQ